VVTNTSNAYSKLRTLALISAGTALVGAAAFAQAPAAPDRAAAVKQALADNQGVLRQYTWIETTEISLKGEEKKEEQKQCYYGADGKVQKTSVPGAAAAGQPAEQDGRGRGGRLKKKVVANKIEEMKEYIGRVVALVHQYVPPDGQKLQAAQAAGNLTIQPSQGVTMLTAKDYIKAGDSVSLGFDATAKKFDSFSVKSYVEKPKEDDVTLAVTFARLVDGTSYPQQIVLDIAAKKLQVKITNSGYKKMGS
jgi:hypothetical protein